jgi:hypothetical protein
VADEILPDSFKTKPNLDRKASEPTEPTNTNAKMIKTSQNTSTSTLSSRSGKQVETVPMKDRDWRGQNAGDMWWETVWEGMDGIGGTNKKGQRCFDRVRIWWRDAPQNFKIPEQDSEQ